MCCPNTHILPASWHNDKQSACQTSHKRILWLFWECSLDLISLHHESRASLSIYNNVHARSDQMRYSIAMLVAWSILWKTRIEVFLGNYQHVFIVLSFLCLLAEIVLLKKLCFLFNLSFKPEFFPWYFILIVITLLPLSARINSEFSRVIEKRKELNKQFEDVERLNFYA